MRVTALGLVRICAICAATLALMGQASNCDGNGNGNGNGGCGGGPRQCTKNDVPGGCDAGTVVVGVYPDCECVGPDEIPETETPEG